jgi:hypothetical protein
MTPTKAHCLSLPLFSMLEKNAGTAVEDASSSLAECIERMKLDEDISVVIDFTNGVRCTLVGKTEFGLKVLEELKARSEFPPCPDGECDFGAEPNCIWCGHERAKS